MFSAGEGVKGLEQCYALPGFDPAAVENQFSYDDANGDGTPSKGEVRYNGEATNQAYACYEQLAKLAGGFNSVLGPKQAYVTMFEYNQEKKIEYKEGRLFSDSPIINKNYATITVNYSPSPTGNRGSVKAFRRDGTVVKFEIEKATGYNDFFNQAVDKLEAEATQKK